MHIIRNSKDVLSGLLFIALATAFAWQGSDLAVGTARSMGPGYLPMLLSGALAILGLLVLINGLRVPGDRPSGVAWKAVIFLTLTIVFFGFAMGPLGFIPTIAIAVFTSTLAGGRFRPTTAIAIAVTLTVFTWAVFILGLALPFPLLGPWLDAH